jgi:predicted secreted acid phosphatase
MTLRSALRCYGQVFLIIIVLATSVFILESCSSPVVNLTDAKQAVNNYYTEGTYAKELDAVLKDARKDFAKLKLDKTSVIIFDVDETTLDNFNQIKKYDFGFDMNAWEDWIQSAAAPPIVPIRDFYNEIKKKGVRIIFLTGRSQRHFVATTKNLKDAGYAGYDTLIVRSPEEEKVPASLYKLKKRQEITNAGYTIVMNFGDLDSDLYGGYSGVAVKLPNMLYCFP